ncbi:flavin-containing monooxygenase [Streptomyces resistomycificus]|uniref:Monooxygenase n=1 Tax=Streptomyces resistomycificus TaxID=67356 RepID=A0A0L8LGI2_9ACTN|nr:NAD(P)/FAD-dependent oxidoreductase [Streptomyces resistomycificus]KOG37166.1 monooxygenase [Streptomyces resistomycificus]KUN95121.1 monooxygenase [Streptomyces resistomycificus]
MPPTPQRDFSAFTIVVGAGPHGLAAAALLGRSGAPTVILERSDRVGASWAQRYDHLSLHTTPGTSKLPGLSVPRQAGPWVSRDDYVRYLESYVAHHRLDVRVTTPVQRIERAEPGSRARWLLHTPDGPVPTGAVVVATGRCHTPNLPRWPGRSTFTGTLLHSAHYRSPVPYRGQHVLVVGAGNSGTEIAGILAGAGAERVRIAVRTPPNILPRSSARWHAVGRLTEALPLGWRDRTSLLTQRLAVPDLTSRGLPRPRTGLYTRNVREGVNPVLDHGFVDAVRSGRVEPVAAVQAFDGPDVLLADGTRLRPDTVIAATGYQPNLHGLVGSLGVLDEAGLPLAVGARTNPEAVGLYFAGYTNPLTGVLRQAGIEARAIAQAFRRETARAALLTPHVGDRTADILRRGRPSG